MLDPIELVRGLHTAYARISSESVRKNLDRLIGAVSVGNKDFEVRVVAGFDIADDAVQETPRLEKRNGNRHEGAFARWHTLANLMQELPGEKRGAGKFARVNRIIPII